jgi:hypothetical protein
MKEKDNTPNMAELWMDTMDELYPETVAKYKKIEIIEKDE